MTFQHAGTGGVGERRFEGPKAEILVSTAMKGSDSGREYPEEGDGSVMELESLNKWPRKTSISLDWRQSEWGACLGELDAR